MNGLELGRRIKADRDLAKLPLILMTTTQFLVEAEEIKSFGFVTYLTKPIRKFDLLQCLLNAMASGATVAETKDNAVFDTNEPLNAHVLVAEDNPVNQRVAQYMLQSLGCTAKTVGNGKEALQALANDTYDLVLMDCMMPEMDGYAATAEIRRLQKEGQLPPFPIIALTANVVKGDRELCLITGMDDYVSKPFTKESLYRALKTWLDPVALKGIAEKRPAESQAAIKTDAIIDESMLEGIRVLGAENNPGFLQEIITLYLNSADSLLQKFETAQLAGDLDKLLMAAHTLKSSSNQVGAIRLAKLCQIVENEANNQNYDSSGETFALIKSELSELKKTLNAYLN
jgi:CheY-like chemotaxis protein